MDLIHKFVDVAEDLFDKKIKIHQGKYLHCSFRGQEYCGYLDELGISKDKPLRVPEFIFKSSTECIRGFIDGLFSCDGHINGEKRMFLLNSAYKEFLQDVQILLSSLNVYTTINLGAGRKGRYKDSLLWKLSVRPSSIRKFLNNIRFDNCLRKKENCITIDKEIKDQHCRRDVEFSKIGEKEVFDLSVENNHNYIANGVVIHNCFLDPTTKKSMGVYRVGGPRKFDGRTCPVCRGRGKI